MERLYLPTCTTYALFFSRDCLDFLADLPRVNSLLIRLLLANHHLFHHSTSCVCDEPFLPAFQTIKQTISFACAHFLALPMLMR